MVAYTPRGAGIQHPRLGAKVALLMMGMPEYNGPDTRIFAAQAGMIIFGVPYSMAMHHLQCAPRQIHDAVMTR